MFPEFENRSNRKAQSLKGIVYSVIAVIFKVICNVLNIFLLTELKLHLSEFELYCYFMAILACLIFFFLVETSRNGVMYVTSLWNYIIKKRNI